MIIVQRLEHVSAEQYRIVIPFTLNFNIIH